MQQKGLIRLSSKPVGEAGKHPRAILLDQMLATKYMLKVLPTLKIYPYGDNIPHDVISYEYEYFNSGKSISTNLIYTQGYNKTVD